MPAGNDAQVAYAELTDSFGKGVGRAEDLILASRQRYSNELRAAQLKDVDVNATALLEDEEVADAIDLPKGATVIDKAVRGDKVVVLVEGEDGRTSKLLADRSDFDVGEEEESAEAVIFASDAAEKYAAEKDLTPETIRQYVPDGEGAKGTFTKKDVAKAAELRAEANA